MNRLIGLRPSVIKVDLIPRAWRSLTLRKKIQIVNKIFLVFFSFFCENLTWLSGPLVAIAWIVFGPIAATCSLNSSVSILANRFAFSISKSAVNFE